MPDDIANRSEPVDTSPPMTRNAVSSVLGDAVEQATSSGVLSIVDQAVVSGANFLTTLIIARTCSKSELGIYALAWTIVMFLAAIQGNLVTVPYTVYCHRHTGHSLATYAGSTLIYQLLVSLAAVVCFLVLDVVLALGYGPESLRPAAWVLLGAIPFILLRDYARRFMFAHLAMATAVTIDIIVAVLQIGTLLALVRFGWLSAAAAYGAMGWACAVACACWWFLDRQPMRVTRIRLLSDWFRNWSFGKWALMSQLTGLGFYMLPWILASVRGEAETGVLAACTTLVGLSHLFVMGLNNFVMPKASRAFAECGAHGLCRVLRKATFYAAVVLGTLCIVIFFVGHALVAFVYGAAYANTGPLVSVLALAALTDAIGLLANAGLWAMDRPAASIIGDVTQLVVTLGVALWLVSPLGALGIAVALVAGRTTAAAVRWSTLWMLMGSVRCKANPA